MVNERENFIFMFNSQIDIEFARAYAIKTWFEKDTNNLKQISFFNGGSVSAFIDLNTDIILYCACNVQINFRVFRHTIINFRSSIFRFTCRDSD